MTEAYFMSEHLLSNPDRLLRINELIPPKSTGKPPLVPVSRSTWWAGVKSGRFPQPVKLGPRTTCWKAGEIKALLELGV